MITKRLSRLGGSCDMVKLELTGTLDRQRLPCGNSYCWSAQARNVTRPLNIVRSSSLSPSESLTACHSER